MSDTKRILLCDQSPIVHQLIRAALKDEDDFEITREVEDFGQLAEAIVQSQPDLIIIDPGNNADRGIQLIRSIVAQHPKLPIIVFSPLTLANAPMALKAIDVGARDFAAKPVSVGHARTAVALIRKQILGKIRQWGRTSTGSLQTDSVSTKAPKPPKSLADQPRYENKGKPQHDTSGSVEIVAIAVSTGGPQVLSELLRHLPQVPTVPFVIVQHMSARFTDALVSCLRDVKGQNVKEAADAELLVPGTFYVAPGNRHLLVQKHKASIQALLSDAAPEHACRPAADPLFRSVAECCENRAVGLVLTGLGKDGEAGARAIKSHGGIILAQDERTSIAWGMPGNVIKNGLADNVLSTVGIARCIRTLLPDVSLTGQTIA